jgi:hypothetical protein
MIALSEYLIVNLADKGATAESFFVSVVNLVNNITEIAEAITPIVVSERYYQFQLDIETLTAGQYQINIHNGETSEADIIYSEVGIIYPTGETAVNYKEKQNSITWRSK